jgi:serine/threonine-protein kinase RsbT
VSEAHVAIRREVDIVLACQKGRVLAEQLDMSGNDQVVLVIAISEVARNIINYAKCGEIIVKIIEQKGKRGVSVVARDDGPGIVDIGKALRGGYSTGEGLGVGLAGAKRLMDEFVIMSQPGKGTMITMKKWKRNG